jgi:hypothetical protein
MEARNERASNSFAGVYPMSANDLIHLEANFKDWLETRGRGWPERLKDIEPFLYYTLDQILKPLNLSDEDTQYGITDHGLDGGIDAIYFLANRNTLVRDDLDLRTSGTSRIRLVMVQVKSSLSETGFKETDVEKFRLFTNDLLDLTRDTSTMTEKYHPHLLTIMRTFKQRYIQLAGNFPEVAIDYYYVTRGDETETNSPTVEAIDRLKASVKGLLPDSKCELYPVNTQGLLQYVKQRKQAAHELTWADTPALYEGVYVGIVTLRDYVEFLKDDHNELNELLFESNVRGYQKNTTVNRDIRATLNPDSARADSEGRKKTAGLNFWQLNNGVTIITSGRLTPLPPRKLSIEDPQIVNGLQTSREIFNYYIAKRNQIPPEDNRSVLVKVIRVEDDVRRDAIIKATNSQNTMSGASLRATEYIHHEIEALFKRFYLYYDRRKGFYKDQGAPVSSIVSVTELIQALVATVLQRPDDARARPGDYLRKESEYLKLFKKDAMPLSAYLRCVNIVRKIDAVLQMADIEKGEQRNVKYYMAYYLACDLSRKLNPTAEDILSIDLDLITTAYLTYCYSVVAAHLDSLSEAEGNPDSIAKGTELLKAIRSDLGLVYRDHAPIRPLKKRKVRDTLQEAGLAD